nr:tmv resistance protein n [Quercus suber]
MCDSKIVRLWNGIKHFGKLKSIKLEDSLDLIATPDVAGVPNLEKLDVKGCKNLIEIHPSIVVHKRLTHLNLEGCHNLNTLPSKFEMESLEILILLGCSKIRRIPEFMGNMISLSKLHLDRTAITKVPSSIAHLTNLASLHVRDCKNLVGLPSIICSFKSLEDVNLAGCSKLDNLPEDLWNLESLEELDPKSYELVITFLSRLRSLPQFPSSTWMVDGCSSLKPLPNGLTLDKFCQPRLFLFNCFNLADNLGWSDMFFRMLSVAPQDIDKESIESTLAAIFGRNLHPKNHVLSNYLYLSCEILVNKHEGATFSEILGKKSVQIKSDHLWLFYLPPQNFNENGRALLSQIDENGFIQIEVRFDCPVLQCLEVKKCGFRLVYKQDIEDIRYMMAHSSNNTCITPYEGLDVHHDFDNSAEAIKIKGSHDKYNGAGPSSEGRLGSSFDVPNSKKIERYIKDVWLMVTPIILTLIMVTLIARIVMKVTKDWCMELCKEEIPRY